MTEYSEITYAVADRIATITLNRPQARNGYTVTMSDELADAFDRADKDEDVRVAVLTGAGDKFCVGADLSAGGFDFGASQGPWQEPAGRCSKRIYTMNKPVIVAMRGAAVGAGITITLAADYRLAGSDTKFGFVFVRRGIFPEGGSAWYLPRLVGMGKAADWLLSGRVFGADEAMEAGLVHAVYEPDEVLDKAYELARDLIANTAPVSVAITRQLLYRMSAAESPFPVHELDSKLIAGLPQHADAVEGIASFFEKRPPEFTLKVNNDLPGYLPWHP
ncbi:enoyl-CoA hydratase [Amycolatopsis sp. K13G38]|uniref:Enoyl-CoA hydratase n=1 Tax=Amycolatopsis acididurans TaxID=2724524 RepID=A0ABX1J1W7_9PSEU|nr:enoyl-CoA hydratase-related protein [Amycolatopsis acididurans]NKQ53790.1 enoyl-CoA hydratase [Amycolatopsis acididurans]